jgi:hypothetical protein
VERNSKRRSGNGSPFFALADGFRKRAFATGGDNDAKMDGARSDTAPVAPTSKSAVSRISKSANLEWLNGRRSFGALPIGKSAISRFGNLRYGAGRGCARLRQEANNASF